MHQCFGQLHFYKKQIPSPSLLLYSLSGVYVGILIHIPIHLTTVYLYFWMLSLHLNEIYTNAMYNIFFVNSFLPTMSLVQCFHSGRMLNLLIIIVFLCDWTFFWFGWTKKIGICWAMKVLAQGHAFWVCNQCKFNKLTFMSGAYWLK